MSGEPDSPTLSAFRINVYHLANDLKFPGLSAPLFFHMWPEISSRRYLIGRFLEMYCNDDKRTGPAYWRH